VLYELTQHPRLAAQLPGTLLDLLKIALESSRVALSLRQDNADVLLYVYLFLFRFACVMQRAMIPKSHQPLALLLCFCQNGLRLLRWVHFMH
jgi:hypothetical protein